MNGIKRLYLFAILAIVCIAGEAQLNGKVQNRPYIDLRNFHYGFSFGLHQQSLIMPTTGYIDPETGKQWFASNDRYDPGFTVGLIGDWRLNQNLSLRLLPTMHFATKHITFREQASRVEEYQDMKSTYISLPVDLKIAAPRHNNYRPYVVAGVYAMYDLVSKSQANLLMKRFNYGVELGIGCDYYLPFFKFCPELKFCYGFNDILETDRSSLLDKSKDVFTRSVKSARSSMFVLTLHFE